MKLLLGSVKALRSAFWSLVYMCLILYVSKLLWYMVQDMRIDFRDMRINRRILRARTIEHGTY